MGTTKDALIGGAISTGAAAAGKLLDMATAGWQRKQQGKLMDMQAAQNRKMADYNHQLQLDMWEKTNYNAQKEQMMKAGINPALMYGQAGAGGTTGSGMAQGVGMPAAPQTRGMDINPLMTAQIELMKAQANQANAQAEKTKGVDTEETVSNIDLIKATKENKDASSALS